MAVKDKIVTDAVAQSKDRGHRRLLLLLALFAVCMLATAVIASVVAYRAALDSAQDGQDLASNVQSECADPTGDLLYTSDLCGESRQVIENAPTSIKGETGPEGPQGPVGNEGDPGPAPSAGQVYQAVSLFCQNNRCRGKAGNNASASQVAQAVALYCNSRGSCRGPVGTAGRDGQDGAQGVQGEQGEPGVATAPSGPQIAVAVQEYCATRNDCAGAVGPTGPAGPPGVIGTETDCMTPEGQVIDQILTDYDPDSQMIQITCTYKNDATIINPAPEENQP